MSDSIISKIQKLIEKANSTDSQHEADAFMAKSQELLLQYNLDMSHVEKHEREEGVIEIFISYTEDFEWTLCNVIARNNLCRTVGLGGRFALIGKKDNIEIVQYLYSFYKSKILDLSGTAFNNFLRELNGGKEVRTLPKKSLRTAFINDYINGAVHGVNLKLSEGINNAKRNEGMAGLILVSNTSVQRFVEKTYPNLRSGRSRSVNMNNAYNQGVSDGRNISVNKGLNSSPKGFIS